MGNILVFDGALGTTLQQMGLGRECMEANSIDHFDDIINIHASYLRAGANVLGTNTFGANLIKLKKSGMDSELVRLNTLGVEAARIAQQKTNLHGIISASIGPCGELPYPLGTLKFDELFATFRPQAEALIAAHADWILLETFSSLFEAKCAYYAIRSVSQTIPVGISFTFENGHTLMGMTPEVAAISISNLHATYASINCLSHLNEMTTCVQKYYDHTTLPILAMPNAGLPIASANGLKYPLTPTEFASYASSFVTSGATYIGGCCGTNDTHIHALVQACESLRPISRKENPPAAITSERNFTLISQLDSAAALAPDIDECMDYATDNDNKGFFVDLSNLSKIQILDFLYESAGMIQAPLAFIASAELHELIKCHYIGTTLIKTQK